MDPVVIVVGEHPQEVSALYLGKKVYERLSSAGYDAHLERMPVELTLIGSIVKGLEPVNETQGRLPLVRKTLRAIWRTCIILFAP